MNRTDNLIINPLTNRPITINGRVYKKLVKDGYELKPNISPRYRIKEDTPIVDNTTDINYNSDSDVSIIDYNAIIGGGEYTENEEEYNEVYIEEDETEEDIDSDI
tara:strand:+ start:540 stop:854 length:315 start_codon:yes stop_codon:yes gene_type:complete